ncbi:hypothetical protein [Saccharopolyspora gloriosae]|uniref:Uncharacterized protein n=1 Tax=Saccharopolyspora gloriosae TaxID=455344 RepID=A0A840N6T9_9PSEU|nr:hypothetical protein [Saccharopolyspora gloriosae]MBB5067364.1 hypothetical protein [Saccharopolyspora gloriosae]
MSSPDPARGWPGVFTSDRVHHVSPANARRISHGAQRNRLGLADCGAVCAPPTPNQWPLTACPLCYPRT